MSRFMLSIVAFTCCFRASAAIADTLEPKWDLELGVGTAWSPDYSGSSASVAQLRLWVNGTYRTGDFGAVAIDSGSLTVDPELRWDFVDSREVGLGALLGYRPGRRDTTPTFLGISSGGEALRGLPDIPDAIDLGIQGHVVVFGLPLFAQVRSALGGTQGTLINVGAYATFSIDDDTDFTLLPTVTWANARQMRAFYGVGTEASAASGFGPYEPGAGWQNAALEISGDRRFLGAWHVVASFAYERLLDGAAKSPIVASKNQLSGLIGLAWHY